MECAIFETHFNGGMQYLNKDKKNKKVNCFGYDFKNCYANFLVEDFLEVPLSVSTKQGTIATFTDKIDILNYNQILNLSYGSYHINIISGNEIITKYFQFSQDHWYTIYDILKLHYLVKYVKQKAMTTNVDQIVELSTLGQCLIYNKENLVPVKTIFKDWYSHVSKLKDKLPKTC